MPSLLSSWKEIGEYLGKGVRTVQRWERESGLPVRRRSGSARHAVLAIPEELDAWTRDQTNSNCTREFASIRQQLETLRNENAELRGRLDSVEAIARIAAKAKLRYASAAGSDASEEWRAYAIAAADLQRAAEALRDSQSLRDASAKLRFAALYTRAQSIRSRISFALTCVAVAETRARIGNPEAEGAGLHKARALAQAVRLQLETPECLPGDELTELRLMLANLEMRIHRLSGTSIR